VPTPLTDTRHMLKKQNKEKAQERDGNVPRGYIHEKLITSSLDPYCHKSFLALVQKTAGRQVRKHTYTQTNVERSTLYKK